MLDAPQADATEVTFIETLKKGDSAAVVSWIAVRPPEGQASEMPITVEPFMIEDDVC